MVLCISITYAQTQLQWSKQEITKIKQFSFKPSSGLVSDPSNKYLHKPEAIKLGKTLFNETRLSRNQKVSCASCHIKDSAFTDNKVVALGVRSGLRNTPTLRGVAQQNWFFWDGSKDSLWAQALSSIENPAEQGFTRIEMLHFISQNPYYRDQYTQLFKQNLPSLQALNTYPEKAGPNGNLDELIAWKKLSKKQRQTVSQIFTNIGKAIASYVSTLKNKATRFDRFVDDLAKNGQSNILTNSEQRGLKLFINNNSGCANCHSGSLFSNKEFHNIGTGIPARDNGRSEVIDAVIRDQFNCLGEYSDAKPEQCLELKYAGKDKHALAGAYKTPSLRSLSKTAPFMHDGRFKNLTEVLEHYANFDVNKARETDLAPIKLNKKDQADIVNFLLTL